MQWRNIEKPLLLLLVLTGAALSVHGCSVKGEVVVGFKLRIVDKNTGTPLQGIKVELVRMRDGSVCQTGKTGADGIWEKSEVFPFSGQPENCDMGGCVLKVYSPSGKVQSVALSNADIKDFRIEREIAIEK